MKKEATKCTTACILWQTDPLYVGLDNLRNTGEYGGIPGNTGCSVMKAPMTSCPIIRPLVNYFIYILNFIEWAQPLSKLFHLIK